MRAKLESSLIPLISSSVTNFFSFCLNLTCTATNRFSLSVGSIKLSLMTSTIPTISFPMFE